MSSLSITLGILFSTVYCNAAILDYSNITPWRIAYAVYPVYDYDEPESSSWVDIWKSERLPGSWIQVWKNERSWDVDNSVLNIRYTDDHKSDNINRETASDRDSHKNTGHLEKSVDNKNKKSEQPLTHPWPKNYKDWPKNVKKDHLSV